MEVCTMRGKRVFALSVLMVLALITLYACGGGGSSDAPATTTITGSVFAAPVDAGSVSVKDTSDNTVAGPVTTATDGTFSIAVPTASLAADLVFESTGGTFTDEATGAVTTAATLGAVAPGGSLSTGSSVNIDPSSTIVFHLVTDHGKTINEAETAFQEAFGYTPDISIAPVNAPPSGTDMSGCLAGLRAITFSKLTEDLGLSPEHQFALLGALAWDLNDGQLDGVNGAAPVTIVAGTDMPEDIQNRFEHALTGLLSDSTINHTGLKPDQIEMLPFSTVALTDTYRVEYVPGMMAAQQGKTTFKIRITRRSDGSAATGLAVSLMPMMYMATHNHSSPVDTVTEDVNDSGAYICTVYYLMASMMSGSSMGYWELKVMIGGMQGETATFYPVVDMAMGSDTVRATLKGQTDLIFSSMTGTENRTYYLFNDGVDVSSFDLFIAAKESMMSYPAISAGTVLYDESGTQWTVNPIDVSVSTDETNWIPATDYTGGHWSVSGLSGLSAGVTGTIYVKITINGEQKTTDGSAVSGANGYAAFTVTP